MANTSTQQDEEPTLAKSDSILDNPDLAEATLLALLCNKTEPLLAYGGQTHKDLVTYSRKWLKLVSDEFRAECNDGLHKKPRGLECTITHLGQLKDAPREAHWVAVKIKEQVKNEDDDASPDPTAMHLMWWCQEHGVIFYISQYQPNKQGDKYRALAFDAEALRTGAVRPPRSASGVIAPT